MLTFLKSFIHSAWSQENSRRSCLLILTGQIVLFLSLLAIGFTYIHVNLPHYNARRLSKYRLVCGTVEDELVSPEHCELPWNRNHFTIPERWDHARRLYENDSHSATISVQKVSRSDGTNKAPNLDEVATERHFTWSSCGEFCSSEIVDLFGCRQLRAKVRKEGSSLNFVGCRDIDVTECPFLVEKDDKIDDNEVKCSTREGNTEACLRLGIFKCVEAKEKSKSNFEVTTTPVPITTTTTTIAMTSKMITTVATELSNETEVTTNYSAFTTSVILTPTTQTTQTTTTTATTTSPPPTNSSSSPFTSPHLECTHIEKLISCNMSQVEQDAFHFRYNCTSTSSQKCFKAAGTYVCDSESLCVKVTHPDRSCARICEGIGLDGKNVVIADQQFGKILTAKCTKGFRDKGKKIELWPGGIKHKNPNSKWRMTPQILITCNFVDWTKFKNNSTRVVGNGTEMDLFVSDCFNGTRLENDTLPPSATLRELQSIWSGNLLVDDHHLDAIQQKDAPPGHSLTIQTAAPLYFNDFYKNLGEGCTQIGENNARDEKCTNFYEKYARLPGNLRGQSVFPCYCRSISAGGLEGNGTFCVVGGDNIDSGGGRVNNNNNIFDHNWEDGLIDFLEDHYILVIVFLVLIFLTSLTLICVLLYPLIADLTPVNNLVLVGVGVTPNSPPPGERRSPSVKFMEDTRSSVFTVGGHSNKDRGDEMVLEQLRTRSRSNSISGVM